MKKKISLLILMIVSVFVMTGCSGSKSTLEYDEQQVTQVTEFLFTYCETADDEMIDALGDLRHSIFEDQLAQMGLPITPEIFMDVLHSWQAGEEECGEYISHGDYKIDATAKNVTVSTEAQFENRDATVEVVFDDDLYVETVTVGAKFTTGEILKKSALNTVLGMGVVFAVLIFISLIISLFGYIPKIQERLAGKKNRKEEPATVVEEKTVTEPVVEVTDDTELVAVIAAAIAAAEGTSTDSFVVRSIKRRKSNKWNA